MIDMDKTITPKSDQLNADDLIGGKTMTITVTDVKDGGGDQPISIYFEGDGGKPYKPGKSMRRVLRTAWGRDGKEYVGKSMTLYCDPNVKFGGDKVGGIRISHMSDIAGETLVPLTVTKGVRKPYTVKPLKAIKAPAPSPQPQTAPAGPETAQAAPSVSDHDRIAKRIKLAIESTAELGDLDALWNVDYKPELDRLKAEKPDYFARLKAQYEARIKPTESTDEKPFPGDTP